MNVLNTFNPTKYNDVIQVTGYAMMLGGAVLLTWAIVDLIRRRRKG